MITTIKGVHTHARPLHPTIGGVNTVDGTKNIIIGVVITTYNTKTL